MKAKVDIISGFLGAGKTTLIKKLVMELYAGERVVILENELGKVNIDSKVFRDVDISVEEITAGCICCSLKEDFMASLLRIKETFQPDRIIIEPTGAALLSEILKSYSYHPQKDEIVLDHIIAVVDVRRFQTSLFISKGFIDNQLQAAKLVVLSKMDEDNQDDAAAVIQYIQEINQHANIAAYDWNQTSAQEIISDLGHPAKKAEEQKQRKAIIRKGISEQTARKSSLHRIFPRFDTWEAETDRLVSRKKISELFHEINKQPEYGRIVRGKGVLEDSAGWFQLDFVFGDLTIVECNPDVNGKICIIGTDLNREMLSHLFGI